MTPADLLLAACLLSAAPGTPEPTPEGPRWAVVTAAILDVAESWELADPRERPYLLSHTSSWQVDLDRLRTRRADFADAPQLSDALRFPPACELNERIRFNRAYRQTLVEREKWEPDRADLIRNVIAETDLLYRAYDDARDVQCDFYYVGLRRMALKRLRDTIGPEAFAAGVLPPYVPATEFPALTHP